MYRAIGSRQSTGKEPSIGRRMAWWIHKQVRSVILQNALASHSHSLQVRLCGEEMFEAEKKRRKKKNPS